MATDASMERFTEEESQRDSTVSSGPAGPIAFDWRAVWQMCSMSIGAGVFAIPAIFDTLGLVQALAWIAVVGCLAHFALERLLDIVERRGVTSYEELAELAFGSAGKVAMCVVMLITTFIGAVSYVATARDLLLNVLAAFLLDVDVNSASGGVVILTGGKGVIALLLLVCVILPSGLHPTLDGLEWISRFGLFSIFTALLFFLVRCLGFLVGSCPPELCGTPPPPIVSGTPADSLELMATVAFNFTLIFAIFPLLQDRADRDGVVEAVRRLRKPLRFSMVMLSCTYALVGLAGALVFGSSTKAFALSSLPLSEPMVQLLTLIVGLAIWMLVAVIMFPTVQALSFLGRLVADDPDRVADLRPHLVAAVGAAMVLADSLLPTKAAFALCGSLGLSLAAYLMPCLLYLRLRQPGCGSPSRRFCAALVFCFGLVLLLGSTPVTLLRLSQSDDGPAPRTLRSLICDAVGDQVL